MGRDWLDYPDAISTPTEKLTTTKCLLNSTISMLGARFMGVDIKDFYLNTPMARYKYMRLLLNIIPDEIICQYKLWDIATNTGWVYIEIHKGMYGLKWASLLANLRLKAHLAKFGYHPTPRMPASGCTKHTTSLSA
jgi:hypothetical protein